MSNTANTAAVTNAIRIDGNSLSGNVATLAFDIDVTGVPVQSTNEKAPKFRLYAQSPRGRRIKIGGMWENENAEGKPYYSLTLSTGHGRFYANLGRYPGQDDDLYAVIPNEYLKLPKHEAVHRTEAEISGGGYMPECLTVPELGSDEDDTGEDRAKVDDGEGTVYAEAVE